MKRLLLSGLTALLVLALFPTAFASSSRGDSWPIWSGKAHYDGSTTVTVDLGYQDPAKGNWRHATIQAMVPNVSRTWGKGKKAQALHDALAKAVTERSMGGQPLIELGAVGGDAFLIWPATDRRVTMPNGSVAGASDIRIENVKVTDGPAQEYEAIAEPGKDSSLVSGIALISMKGDITGLDPDGKPSEIAIDTDLGSAVVALKGSMTPLEVEEALVDQLRALGIDAALDRDRGLIMVVLTNESGGIGSGTSDAGVDWIETAVFTTF